MKRDRLEEMRRSGLSFFGEVTASVTHEIKNSLAVVKEVAGLMADLGEGAVAGRPLGPERVKDLAGRIDLEVRRMDETIRHLNRFAHSVDHPRRTVDVSDLVGLLAALAERWAVRHRVRLTIRPPEAPVPIETDPFLFQHAVFTALLGTIDAAEPGSEVALEPEASGGGARIVLRGSPGRPTPVRCPLAEVLQVLGGRVETDSPAGLLTLSFPREIPEAEGQNG